MVIVDITDEQPLRGRQLQLTFADGLEEAVDLDRVISQYAGIFAPLLNQAYFLQVSLNAESGAAIWPNAADLCPDVLCSYVSGMPVMVNGLRVLN